MSWSAVKSSIEGLASSRASSASSGSVGSSCRRRACMCGRENDRMSEHPQMRWAPMLRHPFPLLTVILCLVAATPAVVGAGVCAVPGTHATIEAAAWTSECNTIELANQTYQESVRVTRPVTIAGPPGGTATIAGRVVIGAGAGIVRLVDLTVRNGCVGEALVSAEGAEVGGSNLTVVLQAGQPCPAMVVVFADGFESGNTARWTIAVP